jgi:hypothetical protein
MARGRVLDDLTVMLLRLSGRVVWRSEQYRAEVHVDKGDQTDALIGILAELPEIVGANSPRRGKLKQVEAAVEPMGAARHYKRPARCTLSNRDGNGSHLRTRPSRPTGVKIK